MADDAKAIAAVMAMLMMSGARILEFMIFHC
jgi:hypothetical protein